MNNLKDLIKGNVYFSFYKDGELWYEAGRHLGGVPFLFPVPISDVGNATFLSVDKGLLFMRYIRKHLDLIKQPAE